MKQNLEPVDERIVQIWQKIREAGKYLPNGNLLIYLDFEDFKFLVVNKKEFEKYLKSKGWEMCYQTQYDVDDDSDEYKMMFKKIRSLRGILYKMFNNL